MLCCPCPSGDVVPAPAHNLLTHPDTFAPCHRMPFVLLQQLRSLLPHLQSSSVTFKRQRAPFGARLPEPRSQSQSTGNANSVAPAAPADPNLGNYHGTGELVPFVNRTFEWGVVISNIFVRFEDCALPLCPFDLLPSPKTEEYSCGANYPTANYPCPAAPAVRLRRTGSLPTGSKKSPSPPYGACETVKRAHHHGLWRAALGLGFRAPREVAGWEILGVPDTSAFTVTRVECN